MAHIKAVLLLACTAGALAGPLNYPYLTDEATTECARTCPDSSKFSYMPGNTYEYNYEADIKTHIPGTTEEHSSLHITSTVYIEAISKCEMALRMSDITLKDSDPQDYQRRRPIDGADEWANSLQEYPLRFAFLDGTIDAICPEDREEWILNVKRGILSSLQNTMVRLEGESHRREIDISGECDVDYKITATSWNSKTIVRNKDMLSCSGHQHLHSMIQSTPYRVSSKLQSLPLLKSTQECTQEVNSAQIISMSECKEMHTFRPFSRGNTGASTEVNQKLRFSRKSGGTRTSQDTISSRKSLTFEHVESMEELETSRRAVQSTLRQLCQETSQDVRPTTPALFSKLVKSLRKLDADTLTTIHRGANAICPKAHEFMHDALPTLGTTSAVRVMKNLVLSGEADELEADIWFTSMSFISDPTRQMLADAKSVLTSDQVNRKAILAISALAHSYCRLHEDCGEHQELRDIIAIFENNLRYNCKTTNEEMHDKVIMSLKAIGNTGHAESVAPTLTRCIQNEENPMLVRISAINAFRRMACHGASELSGIFRNTVLDSELRINAYLTMMECPSDSVLKDIRETLEIEEINQVGSFVWTHLTNLLESSSPMKQEIRHIVEQQPLVKKFDLDKRKFSRNIELSGFSTMLNAGGSVESNLIWSSKSWIPRSGSVELAVDIFGQSVQLLEIGGRVQGADGIMEKVFANKDVNEVLKRQKRDVISPRAFNEFNSFSPDHEDNIKGSYYIRVFGNEIRYDDFHGFDMDTVKAKFNYLEWLIELAREHEIDATKSIQFLDSSLVVPTAIGLPLKLSVDGSAVMDVKVRGKLDLRNIGTAPRSMDIDGSIRPSAAVEITGEMGVDAWIAKTGLKMVSTLHTSSVADGKIKLMDGQIFNLDVNMPNDRVELFDFKSEFFIVHRENSREQQMSSEGRIEKDFCIQGKLKSALGVKLCGEMGLPSLRPKEGQPWFPFNGPFKAKMFVEKEDTHTGYHMEAKVVSASHQNPADELKLSFNTPGSSADRELTFDYTLNRQTKALAINMRSPWKKAELTSGILDEDNMKRFTARALIDEQQEYNFKTEMAIESTKLNTNYIPTIELRIPGKEPYRMSGNILYRPSKKIDIDLTIDNVFTEGVTLSGDATYIKKRGRWQSSLALNAPDITGTIEGYFEKAKSGLVSSRIGVEYAAFGQKAQRFTLSNKWRNLSNKNRIQYSADTAITSTVWPQWNMDGAIELTKAQKSYQSSGDIGLTDTPKRIKWEETFTDNSNGNMRDYDGTAKLEMPFLGVDYQLTVDHQNTKEMAKHTTTIKYAPRKELVFNFDAEMESRNPIKARIDTSVKFPGREWGFSETLEEKNPKEYHHTMDIKLDAIDNINVQSVYKMQPKHEVTATITAPNLMQPLKLRTFVNPELKNFEGHAEAMYGSDMYVMDANWFHSGQPVAFSTRAGLEVAYPGRRIKTEGEFTRRSANANGRIDVKWDVDRDPRKKVTINGEVSMDPAQPTFQIKTQWYPSKFVEVSGNLKNDQKGWYHVTRDLEGSLRIITSYRGYENMDFMFSHDQAKESAKTHAELSWAKNQKIEYDFTLDKPDEWNEVKTTWIIKTPFPEYRIGEWELNYKLTPQQFTGGTKFNVNGQILSINGNGRANIPNHIIDTSLIITTPFQGYEDMSASFKHNDNGQIYNSEFKGGISNHKVAIKFNMDHQLNGWMLTNKGSFSFTCPKGTKVLKWNHQNNKKMFKCEHELDWMGKKTLLKIDANHSKNYKKRSGEIKSSITSAYFDDILFNFEHEHLIKNYKNIKTSGNFQWKDNKNIAFTNVMSYVPNKYSTKSLKITTPFKGYEKLSSTVNSKVNGNIITSRKEIKWGPNNKITSDVTMTLIGNYQFEYDWKMTTPFKPVQRMMAKLSNMQRNDVWKTSLEGQLNKDKAELSTEFGMYPPKFMMIVKTPHRYLRNGMIDFDYTGNPRDFTTKVIVNHNLLDEDITLEMKLDTANLNDIKGDFSLQTPFETVKDVKSIISHKLLRGTYKTDYSIQVPRNKATVSNEFTFNGWNHWNGQTSVEYGRGKKIDIMASFAMTRAEATGNLEFRSPYPGAELYKINFNHRGNPNNFETKAEVTFAPRQTIASEVTYKNNRNGIQASAEVTTPFREFTKGAVSFSHEGPLQNSKQTVTMEMNRQRITGTHDMSFDIDSYMYECTTIITTPFPGWEDIELKFKHDGAVMDFTNDITFRYNENVIHELVEFANNEAGLKAKYEFSSPYEYVRNIKFEIDHSGSLRNFRNSGTVQYNGQRYTGNTEYRNSRRGYSAVAAVLLPQEYRVSVNQDGDYSDMTHRMELNYDGQKIDTESLYKNDGRNIESSIRLRTPYENYEKTRFSLNHRNTGRGFVTAGDLDTSMPGYKKFNFEVGHEGNKNDFKTTASMVTPFEKVPVANFEMNHRGQLNDFTSSGAIDVNGMRYSGNVGYKYDRSGIEATAAVQSPHRKYENQGFAFAHKPSRTGFMTTASVDTSLPGYRNFNTEINHSGNLKNFESTLKLETPLEKLPVATLGMKHSGDPKDFTTTVTLDYNGEKTECTTSFKKIGGWWETDHEASLSFRSPYKRVKDLEIKTEHKDMGNKCSGSIDITHNSEKMIDAEYQYEHGNNANLDFTMRDPLYLKLQANNEEATFYDDARMRPNDMAVKFQYGIKNEQSRSGIDRRIKFQMVFPRDRMVGFDTGYTLSDDKFTHDMDYQWGPINTKTSYNVESSISQRRRQKMFDWKLDVTSPYGPFEINLNNNYMPNRIVTELGIKGREKLTLKNEIVIKKPNFQDFTITTTASHPKMRRDAILKIEGVMQPSPIKYDGGITLQYATQNFEFSGKIADESQGLNTKYVAEAKATHPGSFLDFDFKSELVNNRETVGGNMQVLYQTTRDRQTKTMGLRTEINKLRDELNLEIQSPLHSDIRLTGRQARRDHENGIHKFTLNGNVASNEISGELEIDTSSPGAEMKLNYSPRDMIHIYGRYLTPSHMQFEASHENNGQQTQDAHFSLRLDNGGMLGTRAFIRPQIKDDIQAIIDSMDTSDNLDSMASTLADEWKLKKRYILRSAAPLQDVQDYASEAVVTRLEPFRRDFQRAYERNEFYSKDAFEKGQEYYKIASEKINEKMTELEAKYGAKWDQMKQQFIASYRQWKQQAYYDLQMSWQELDQWSDKTWSDMSIAIDRFLREYQQMKQEMYASVQNYAPNGIIETLENVKTAVTEFYDDVLDRLNKCEYIQELRARISQAMDEFLRKNEWLVEMYWRSHYYVKDQWQQIMSYPEAQQIKAIVDEIIATTKYWYDYMEFEKQVQELYNTMKNTNWDTLKEQAKLYLQEKLQWDRNRIIVWDPQGIEFQAEIYIPVEIRDLQSLPRPNIQKYITRVRNWIQQYMPADDYVIYDSIYKYKPSLDYYNWVPPFKAHATVSGTQHYMTFDKHFYEFSGECSYLLAHDFIDGNFSVVINYDNVGGQMTKKSITVLLDGKQIEIFPTFKVVVDGKRSELPLEFGNTVVRRIGNFIRVHSNHGVTVVCDLPHDLCTVNVTGWYFGKTGGLFGTYDNEPSTDFTKSDNTMATTPEELASSWTVGERCRVGNNAIKGRETPDRTRICAKYFRDQSSSFRMCFKQVPNEPFMQMCLNNMPRNINHVASDSDICTTAAFYVKQCELAEVPLRMPTNCVQCEMENGRIFTENDYITLEGEDVPMSGDVVLVVSERDCNREIIDTLSKVVSQIDKAMKAEGMKAVRYSLVGYGNNDNTPHSHTMQSEIFNENQKFDQAVHNFHIVERTEADDPLTALEFAAKLSFRTGVSKTLILIPCGSCEETVTSYLEIQQLLINRDIHLHVLLQQDFQLRKNTPTSSYIFGVDKDGVFTQKHVGDRELMGDKDLRKQVIMPKDLCVALTVESDGSVFNAMKLSGRPAAQKKFIDVMTRLIAKKGQPTECQICQCMVDASGVGQSVCKNCQTRHPIYSHLPSFDNADYFESESESSDSSDSEEMLVARVKQVQKPKKVKKPKKFKKGRNYRNKQ